MFPGSLILLAPGAWRWETLGTKLLLKYGGRSEHLRHESVDEPIRLSVYENNNNNKASFLTKTACLKELGSIHFYDLYNLK